MVKSAALTKQHIFFRKKENFLNIPRFPDAQQPCINKIKDPVEERRHVWERDEL